MQKSQKIIFLPCKEKKIAEWEDAAKQKLQEVCLPCKKLWREICQSCNELRERNLCHERNNMRQRGFLTCNKSRGTARYAKKKKNRWRGTASRANNRMNEIVVWGSRAREWGWGWGQDRPLLPRTPQRESPVSYVSQSLVASRKVSDFYKQGVFSSDRACLDLFHGCLVLALLLFVTEFTLVAA